MPKKGSGWEPEFATIVTASETPPAPFTNCTIDPTGKAVCIVSTSSVIGLEPLAS